MLFFILLLQVIFPQKHAPVPAFAEQLIDSNISIGYGLAIGDVDGDGKKDILLADKKQFVWYRNGDWKKFLMAEDLTEFDNVCIAARDVDGDGKVEVAVGAQWNPSETSNQEKSGSVHYLVRPQDPTQKWQVVNLKHEPTIHRMRWVRSSDGKFYLFVLPLHGRGNVSGNGTVVNLIVFEYNGNDASKWPVFLLPTGMHMTHNLDVVEPLKNGKSQVFISGKEGIRVINEKFSSTKVPGQLNGMVDGSGEVRKGKMFLVTIQPMHGQKVVMYPDQNETAKVLLDTSLNEGHALGVADFLGTGTNQVVAGWRGPDKEGLTGIRLYSSPNAGSSAWDSHWIDKNGMACEDLQVADMDGDGRPDIVASGRGTHNVKIYWNKNKK